MSEAQNGSAPPPAVQRAEALLDRFTQRVREARAEAERKEATAPSAAPEAPDQPATERADEILDRTGEQLGRLASTVSLRVRKAAALAREEAEDILAEAQNIRHGSRS